MITAAVLTQTNQPLELVSGIQAPALKPGQVLVKNIYAGLCHSQLMEAQGKRGEDKYLPHMLGHEGVGLVEEIGQGVTKVAIGDKVVLGWIKGEGMDAGGSVYQSPIGAINAGSVTTFSTHSVVSENRLVKCPAYLNDQLAVLLGCALPTGAGIVLNQLQPRAGADVLVFGLGGIGFSALLALNNFKLGNIVAVDLEQDKLDLAREFGAIDCFLADSEGLEQLSTCYPEGFDFVVEAAGKAATIERAFELTRRGGGKCMFASHPPNGELIKIDPYELICGKQLIGSWGGGTQPDKDIPVIADIIASKCLPVDKLLSKSYRLADINVAMEDLANRKIVRALIDVQ